MRAQDKSTVFRPNVSSSSLTFFCKCAATITAVPWPVTDGKINKLRREFLTSKKCSAGKDSQILRVAISILCDLRLQGWSFHPSGKAVIANRPVHAIETPEAAKARIRAGLLIERDELLRRPGSRRFIAKMEQRRLSEYGEWVSIFSLMRDGAELAKLLREVQQLPTEAERVSSLQSIIQPYVQIVDDGLCAHTGLALKDIWRYFRYLWTNAPKSVPGRNVWILIRDAAAPHHPVIGIAALGSAVVQLSVRDAWIGWMSNSILDEFEHEPTDKWADWLESSLADLLSDIYSADFQRRSIISRKDLRSPTAEAITALRAEALSARKKHHLYPNASEHKIARAVNWRLRAETYLFRSKRAEILAELLEARATLRAAGFTSAKRELLLSALRDPGARQAIGRVLRRVKAKHVGINMLDITVCGAIPPYGPLLGGKLVAMLMASPEITVEYENRYARAASVIASAVAGRAIRRKPQLVLLGTTSLYSAGSSQYNRIRIPLGVIPGMSGELRYLELGHSEGYGSYHISAETFEELHVLLAQRGAGRRVNSIFGEGVSPRLRKVREALEAIGLTSDPVLKHGEKRIVYGIALASNFRDVLFGLDPNPQWLMPHDNPSTASHGIVAYWMRRWLAPRIMRPGIIHDVAQHELAYPITHAARVTPPADYDDMPLFAGT